MQRRSKDGSQKSLEVAAEEDPQNMTKITLPHITLLIKKKEFVTSKLFVGLSHSLPTTQH